MDQYTFAIVIRTLSIVLLAMVVSIIGWNIYQRHQRSRADATLTKEVLRSRILQQCELSIDGSKVTYNDLLKYIPMEVHDTLATLVTKSYAEYVERNYSTIHAANEELRQVNDYTYKFRLLTIKAPSDITEVAKTIRVSINDNIPTIR